MATEATPNTGANSAESLNKLTAIELENLARSLYGLNISNGTPKKDLIELIVSATQKYRGNAEMQVVSPTAKPEDVEVPDGFVKIRVSPGPHNPKAPPIIVGLNFKMASIPCNRDVVMHGKWLSPLQDAVEGRAVMGVNEEGREELQFVEGHKYPFTILVDNRKR